MTQDSWIWLDAEVLLAFHEEQLAEHGGAAGVRDVGLFELALARARQLEAYVTADVADRAAAYGFGLARNHPFADGNKRTAFVAVELFLALNGQELAADDGDCVLTMLALAAGDLDERAFSAWVRKHIKPL